MTTKQPQAAKVCPRCDGTREEPGAPLDEELGTALCSECGGSGVKKTKQPQASPLPWEVKESEYAIRIEGGKDTGFGRTLASLASSCRRQEIQRLDAALIVHAVNSMPAFEALKEAAKSLHDALAKGDPQYSMNAEEGLALNALDAALRLAEEPK